MKKSKKKIKKSEKMKEYVKDISEILKNCTLEYFGQAKHKIVPPKLSTIPDVLLLDVRSKEEFAAVSLPFGIFSNIEFLHIPICDIPDRVDEIPTGKNIAVFCPSNFRSTLVLAYLEMLGYESVRILSGGYAGLTEILMPGKVYKHVSEQST